ncbi:unnamed protein product [Rotaria socialis]|uniref:Ion transport domain-containing protein n=5 Tax=Rotaria socialis TaxID=392032 RepID=A0A818UHY2_9BILA|nr:unnamed protein product [Rotaria socialis]CAF3400758.1 unnamed protein product [Rotaria socialis]CAF3684703.1 unnamed protein product [Rotaria socialis]CAF3700854.1 unnamed protein product [Rotaria socialis]CAF4326922.1 unnamed protein product [Rotaria socialis]
MGNTTSEVASGVKAQINSDGQGPELYRFVDLKGSGEFIDVMRVANRTKDYTQIDALIHEHIPRFLYNSGDGKLVTISEIVKRRNNTYSKLKSIIPIAKTIDEEDINCEETKHVCWDLDLRGGVGEHILHICFLSSSPVHSALAKRLLRYYPRLIDDLYMGDEYYGENVLHIAIVNEEPATVKFLLDAGVDFTQRCCGKFFCPEDQKSSRVDNVARECPEVSVATNYEGYCYFGEYPLSFAAVLQQEESVRLLVAKGADTNCQDSNGNTALHMCVIYNRISMVDLIYELGGTLDIKNRQGLTPLTLAAVKAGKEMFDHILQKTRIIYWQYGNVTCAGYPLDDIDTIGKDGSLDDTSALNIIVRGESAGHLDMMDGLIVQLLNEKWRTFIKFKFFQRMAMFSFYFAICLIGLIIRGYYRVPQSCLIEEVIDKDENRVKSTIANRMDCKCHYTNFRLHKPNVGDDHQTISSNSSKLYPSDDENNNRIFEPKAILLNIFDGLSVLGALIYLILTIQEFSYQNFKLGSFIYLNDPTRVLFLFSCVLTIAMLPARFTCSIIVDDVLCVFAILTRAPYFFFFCRGFRTTGPFVVMIYTMIRGDLLRFCLIFLVFMAGFTQALHVLFVRVHCENDFATVIETFFHMFCVTLQQVTDAYENFNRHPIIGIQIIGKIWFITYIVIAAVLLVNMLIAMMGNTYAMVNERKKEWLRQWAKIMLIIEQSVSREERLAQQSNYSKRMPDGSRLLITRLIQSADERTSIESMRSFYYDQLRRHLEPESISIQSKTKSIAAISQHSSLLPGPLPVKNNQDLLRNLRTQGSFSSFDTTALS